jgi:DNA repair protein RadC
MSRPIRSHRRRRPERPPIPSAEAVLRTPDEALRVVLAAVAEPAEAETIVLMLDARHRGGTCLVCRGASSAEQVASLVPVLVQAAANEPALAAVVLATVRPDIGIAVSRADEATFGGMRQDLSMVHVDLLDWFLLGGDLVASVAELTGACWRWSGTEPSW